MSQDGWRHGNRSDTVSGKVNGSGAIWHRCLPASSATVAVWLVVLAVTVLLSGAAIPLRAGAHPGRTTQSERRTLLRHVPTISREGVPERSLVIYVYHESSRHYLDNLTFFLKVAVEEGASPLVDHVLIVNGESSADLGGLPASVRVVRRDNTCFDGGSIGELLALLGTKFLMAYGYFVFMNASVRGPFLPRYWSKQSPWTEAFTSLLSDEVKLVGTTISCEGGVHVQSMVLATDRVGLAVLQQADVFRCPKTLLEAVQFYERGCTEAIFKAGYSVESLMTRYDGVDWRVQRNLLCNQGLNPTLDMRNDGMNADPFELVFVKAKPFPVVSSASMLRRYTDYKLGQDDMSSNEYLSATIQDGLEQEHAELSRRVLQCEATFDVEYYLRTNPDLHGAMPQTQLRSHFDGHGFKERRPYKFSPSARRASEKECQGLAAAPNELSGP